MITEEEFLKWKENKVTKALFEFIEHAQHHWERAFLLATPHFETIGGMAQLQGRIEVCKELQVPTLYEDINNNLEREKEDSDGGRN